MTILVTGATGRVGRHVIQQLVKRGAGVRVLSRDPAKAEFPAGVEVVKGDLLDISSLRAAFSGVSTLFLLNAVTGDEFTQAIITLNIAREAGVDRVVYLSVIHADRFVNVPHFAVKFGAERMLEQMGFGAMISRSRMSSSTTVSTRCRSAARESPWSMPAILGRSQRSS
jgi:uncharacterized protein YbjT (DUF2867 family)